MNWFGIALRDIRAQWLRYLLTGLTMLLGVVSLVGVTVAGGTVSDALIAKEEQESGRAVSVSAAFEMQHKYLVPPPAGVQLPPLQQFLASVRNTVGEDHAGLTVATQLDLRDAQDLAEMNDGTAVETVWIDGELDQLYRIPVLAGRGTLGQSVLPPELLLNSYAAELLGVQLGDTLRMNPQLSGKFQGFGPAAGVDASVVGIVADGQNVARSYGSIDALIELFPGTIVGAYTTLSIVVPQSGEADAKALLTQAAQQAGISLAEDPRRSDTVQTVAEQIALISAVFRVVALMLLAVAVLGIANVGMATVAERAHELSVRRAIGARPRDVFAQMLGAGVLVGFAVSVVAVGTALAGVYLLLPRLLPDAAAIAPPGFPWEACLVGVCAAIGVSLLGGALPAFAAVRIPVAEALRR